MCLFVEKPQFTRWVIDIFGATGSARKILCLSMGNYRRGLIAFHFSRKSHSKQKEKCINTEHLPFRIDLNPKLSVNNFGAARDPEV